MRVLGHFRKSFLTGLLMILPLVITIWLFSLIFAPVQRFATRPVVALLRWAGLGFLLDIPGAGVAAGIIGIVLTGVVIYLVGLIGSNVIGRQFVRGMDNMALSIPLVKSIYGSAKQLLETFSARTQGTFEAVVLIQYPRKGIYTVGLLTSRTAGEPQQVTSEELVNVFVPTTPNPTSGVLVMVPYQELIPLQMTVEDALKLVVSGGIVVPPETHLPQAEAATTAQAPAAPGSARP